MSLEFFETSCQKIPKNKKEFGIRDDIENQQAYIDEDNRDLWEATVKNDKEYDIVFTAIDKCVIKDNEFEGRGRCEGMLTTEKHLFLVELKNREKLNSAKMLDQLISTIKFLKEFHSDELNLFTNKKVFGCNHKKKGNFFVIDNEFQKSFQNEHGFRVDIQTNIVVI